MILLGGAETGMEVRPARIPGTNFRQSVYVPRDEDFSIDKTQGFQGDSLKGLQSTLVPMLRAKFDETPDDFDNVHQLYSLYRSGLNLLPENPQLQPSQKEREDVRKFLEDYVQENSGQRVQLEEIKYQPPQIVDGMTTRTPAECDCHRSLLARRVIDSVAPLILNVFLSYMFRLQQNPRTI